jgi:hypothetical protein
MRRLAALTLLIIATAAAPALAAPVTSVTQAPYTVLMVSQVRECTGTLIDPSHVLTAADCVLDFNGNPLPASAFGILAGTVAQGLLGPEAQHSAVDQVRIHPAFLTTKAADVAMLHLATPLATTAAVAPVPTVAGGTYLRTGSTVTGYGWGRTGGDDPNAQSEHSWEIRVTSTDCRWGVAGYACGTSPADPACNRDIGGPVVAPSDPARLIGVVVNHGPDFCGDTQDWTDFVDLATPGIAQWVLGDDAPDPMPSTAGSAVLHGPTGRGGGISCTPPAWANASSQRVDFVQTDTGRVVQTGRRRTYVPKPSDLAHELGCRSVARSAGGAAQAASRTTVSIIGRRAGRYRVCVKPASAAPTCRWWRPR